MALERIPSDIRADGGIARMSDPSMIKEIQDTVSIPVMAKCRIGHFAEAQILEALEIDFIDESEVLTPADEKNHIWKHTFKVPFVCGCRNLGEALRRIGEGAALIRTKGEAGSGNIIEAVRHMREVQSNIKKLTKMDYEELMAASKDMCSPFTLVQQVKYVILPHIMWVLFPPLSNHYIIMTIGTSMAAIFGVEELTGRAFNINSETFIFNLLLLNLSIMKIPSGPHERLKLPILGICKSNKIVFFSIDNS